MDHGAKLCGKAVDEGLQRQLAPSAAVDSGVGAPSGHAATQTLLLERSTLPCPSGRARGPWSLAPTPHGAEHDDVDDVEALIERSHVAWDAFMRGDPSISLQLFSRRDDVTICNPFVPYARGERAFETIAKAAGHYRDGGGEGHERVATFEAADLVGILEIERYRAKIDGSDEISHFSLRVSSLLRREPDGWRICFRHADPITTPRGGFSVLERPTHS